MSRRADELLWPLVRGALATRVLGIVAGLGVADALADGPRPVADLAAETGAGADSLHRFLRALASEGVFEEVSPGVFGNTDASELLGRRGDWGDFARLFGGVWLRAVAELQADDGPPTFPRAFGTDFWSWLSTHPDERAAFDRAMVDGLGRRLERLSALEWHEETVVDVGGGNGSLLAALCARHGGLRGIVFDLPETNRDDAALGERCTFVAGSFFERVPAGDAYILSTILHDWPDQQAAAILRSIRTSAPAHARLLVLDAVVPPGNGPHGAKWLDVLMLTLFAGRERDESEWHALFDGTGFEPVRIEDGLIEARCR